MAANGRGGWLVMASALATRTLSFPQLGGQGTRMTDHRFDPDHPFDIVGFDLDGTLLNTGAELAASVNHTLGTLGLPTLPADHVLAGVGLGARNMLIEGVLAAGGTEADATAALPTLLDHYRDHLGSGSPAYPGLAEALDGLDAAGVTLGVVTNKFERFAETLLDRTGWRARFACVIGGDTMGRGFAKPHPAPIHEMIRRCGGGRAAFVGDSIHDVRAAQAAGVPAIAAAFGFSTGPAEASGADAAITHYDQLMPTLARLGQVAARRAAG